MGSSNQIWNYESSSFFDPQIWILVPKFGVADLWFWCQIQIYASKIEQEVVE